MEILIIWIVGCFIIGWLADSTTLGFGSGFLLSLLLSPFLGLIITLFYPNKKK